MRLSLWVLIFHRVDFSHFILLLTELVYYYVQLSYVLPVLVGVLFTLLHALIQAYVLTMLTALFYGEVSEHPEPASGRA